LRSFIAFAQNNLFFLFYIFYHNKTHLQPLSFAKLQTAGKILIIAPSRHFMLK